MEFRVIMDEEKGMLVQNLIDIVNEIAAISDYRCTVKKQYCNLARRLKLLTPMFEEIKESKEVISEETVNALVSLKETLASAKELLRFGSEGSKIYLVCMYCSSLITNLFSLFFFIVRSVWLIRNGRK